MDIIQIIGGILVALFGIILFVRERRNNKSTSRSVLYIIMVILGISVAAIPLLIN